MPGPFIEDAQLTHARKLAEEITEPIFELIRRNTTVSIERTVLRFFGISDAGPGGVPLANLMVDRLKAAGVLNRGAAYWYGRALQMGARSPLEAVERLTALPAEKLGPLSPEMEHNLREAVQDEARAAMDDLKSRITQRDALRKELGSAPAPHKYVIVATGNIYDDVDQARAAAQAGADIIAVIRSTAQSLLDYVPHGATTEGYGGTYATQENFRIMREALDDESRKLKRYIQLTNYSSGLCMAEIAFAAAYERLDMLLNDAMYGILFRDINMRRTFIDQYFSRRICALAGIIINTGEDNYITTADAYDAAHTVIASQFINESFAKRAGLKDWQLGLGHSYEIDPYRADTLLLELSQAMLVRRCFPNAPLKYMPPTKHKETDIFFSHAYDVMADLVAIWTRQGIQLLGMMTEAMHTPLLADRYVALKAASYIYRAAAGIDEEFTVREDGKIANRARAVFAEAMALLEECQKDGMVAAIGRGRFGDVKRAETGGKGLDGVLEKAPDYFNPFQDMLEAP
ncbi:lysine 5,6-aminomutase subunit alpha [Vitiosangium sp. GDMCC 1.1324]|uniref:lysine 5,6-aminomutase subunit alpha n=1 Tax=Vitiosangium sp. (strain GDMCC 1.1324) TaxID=2138576 RepID=UPI000D36DD8E|nr:lysine 5,6-aminomutase subunit alpha [Vitiosangium sp. GDMCC 1.1324]PTL77190.1 D-lysine 5,6-aminomutase subunit alpha [Vitiosangium sp. GDMCC 1.1324]